MGKRASYHHGDLRAALVDAALAVIAEQGIDALSVAEAARRTGVSAAAPYRHFPTRLDLLKAAARVYVRFVVRHRAGLDLIFDERLRVGDQALAGAGRAVMDVLLAIALDVAGDPTGALDLLEKQTAAAHGYAVLHLSGFLGRWAPALEDVAEGAADVSRALAARAARGG